MLKQKETAPDPPRGRPVSGGGTYLNRGYGGHPPIILSEWIRSSQETNELPLVVSHRSHRDEYINPITDEPVLLP